MSCYGIVVKNLTLGNFNGERFVQEALDTEIAKYPLSKELSPPTSLKPQTFYHLLRFGEERITKRVIVVGRNYMRRMCTGFPVWHVLMAWSVCVKQARLVLVPPVQSHIPYSNTTVLKEVIECHKHRYAPYSKGQSLFSETLRSDSAHSVHTLALVEPTRTNVVDKALHWMVTVMLNFTAKLASNIQLHSLKALDLKYWLEVTKLSVEECMPPLTICEAPHTLQSC